MLKPLNILKEIPLNKLNITRKIGKHNMSLNICQETLVIDKFYKQWHYFIFRQ